MFYVGLLKHWPMGSYFIVSSMTHCIFKRHVATLPHLFRQARKVSKNPCSHKALHINNIMWDPPTFCSFTSQCKTQCSPDDLISQICVAICVKGARIKQQQQQHGSNFISSASHKCKKYQEALMHWSLRGRTCRLCWRGFGLLSGTTRRGNGSTNSLMGNTWQMDIYLGGCIEVEFTLYTSCAYLCT